MNNYIKQLVEAFDFNSVTKQKKAINVHDILLENKIKEVVYKILNKPKLGKRDASFILSLPPASYKTNDNEIRQLIEKCIKFFGNNCNLNWIDTSEVTDMHELFYYGFYGDISKWDVSNVINMERMFVESYFSNDISNWNVSNVINMERMFYRSRFNGDISNWNVSNVKTMESMFSESTFNNDISKWDVSNVENMRFMFAGVTYNDESSKFNGDIGRWNVSNVTDMEGMFWNSEFNRDISNWNINPNCNIDSIFKECKIKEIYKPKIIDNIINNKVNFSNINNKNNINILLSIIKKIAIKEPIQKKEYKVLKSYTSVYKVKDKEEIKDILYYFNGTLYMDPDNLNWIDTSDVTDMSELFAEWNFNADISKWNVSNVTNMHGMFRGNLFGIRARDFSVMQTFNRDISKWDVSNVTDMGYMFTYSQFNGDISKWNVSNVKNMEAMFGSSWFNRDISRWNINKNCNVNNMFIECHIKDEYKPQI